jgi:hypothetical protein
MRTGSNFGAESMICRSSISPDWVRAALGSQEKGRIGNDGRTHGSGGVERDRERHGMGNGSRE